MSVNYVLFLPSVIAADKNTQINSLVIFLTKTSTASFDPVLGRFPGWQQDRQHKVGGVASCGQNTFTLTGLVYWTPITFTRLIYLIHTFGPQPDNGHGFVQNFRLLFFQTAPKMEK